MSAKAYVHKKSGERREFADSVYKNLSKTLKEVWVPEDEMAAQVASTGAKSIPPANVTVNSNNKNVDEAHDVLAEVFDELGIAKPDGSILDMAITAAGALRSAHAGLRAVKTAEADGIEKEPVKELEKKEDAKGDEPKALKDYTKAELQDALTKRGIVYGARDSKDELIALLKNAD